MRVEVDLENTSNELRDGMFGRVTVQLSRSPKEVSIPSTCLLSGSEGSSAPVYVIRNDQLAKVPVKVGRDNGVQAEILSGLRPEDLVVRHPTSDLYPGEKVNPVETPNNTAAQASGNPADGNAASPGPAASTSSNGNQAFGKAPSANASGPSLGEKPPSTSAPANSKK